MEDIALLYFWILGQRGSEPLEECTVVVPLQAVMMEFLHSCLWTCFRVVPFLVVFSRSSSRDLSADTQKVEEIHVGST